MNYFKFAAKSLIGVLFIAFLGQLMIDNQEQLYTEVSTDLPLATVDVNFYLGVWYDIAHIPYDWGKDCFCTTISLGLQVDGSISLRHSCNYHFPHRPLSTWTGSIRPIKDQPAKLKIRFPYFYYAGDLIILNVAYNYDWIIVGSPDRKYFWILSRVATMKDRTFTDINDIIRPYGYPLHKLVMTNHNCQ